MMYNNIFVCTTAVDDMDRNEPTNRPSDNLAPNNCKAQRTEMFSFHFKTIMTTNTIKISIKSHYNTVVRMPHKNINDIIWRSPPRTATVPTAFNFMNWYLRTASNMIIYERSFFRAKIANLCQREFQPQSKEKKNNPKLRKSFNLCTKRGQQSSHIALSFKILHKRILSKYIKVYGSYWIKYPSIISLNAEMDLM